MSQQCHPLVPVRRESRRLNHHCVTRRGWLVKGCHHHVQVDGQRVAHCYLKLQHKLGVGEMEGGGTQIKNNRRLRALNVMSIRTDKIMRGVRAGRTVGRVTSGNDGRHNSAFFFFLLSPFTFSPHLRIFRADNVTEEFWQQLFARRQGMSPV